MHLVDSGRYLSFGEMGLSVWEQRGSGFRLKASAGKSRAVIGRQCLAVPRVAQSQKLRQALSLFRAISTTLMSRKDRNIDAHTNFCDINFFPKKLLVLLAS